MTANQPSGVPDVSDRSLASLISLEGRAAVITGGAQGIGFAIAKRFVEAGAKVMLADLNSERVCTAAQSLSRDGEDPVVAEVVDVTDSDAVSGLADAALHQLGGLDIWVNNAGAYPTTHLLEMDDEHWDRVLDLNLRGTFVGSREAARRMVAGGRGGVIINMSSTAGYRAFAPGLSHYTTSKHAIRGLTKSLAVELGPHQIRAYALAPTLIVTEGIAESRADHEASGLADNHQDELRDTHPLRRLGVPDDVARVALFCASDLALFMSGCTLPVDAGLLAV